MASNMHLHQTGLRRGLEERGILRPDTTIITPDSWQLLTTKPSLVNITNRASRELGRKLTPTETEALIRFIAELNPTPFYQKSYAGVVNAIALSFLARFETQLKLVQEQELDDRLSGVDEITDQGGIQDYNKQELLQFSTSENPFKFSAHADRRGNAVIDRERVEGKRSSPNSLHPASQELGKSQLLANREVCEMSELLKSLLAPEAVDGMFTRIQAIYANYFSINLPRQIIQFDSRNRLFPEQNRNEYRWNVHPAGRPGYLGDVRIQDTLQQIIRMRLFPFWAPVNASILVSPYQKIRLLLREFSSQSATASEFNDPNQSIPTFENYHFELEVREVDPLVGDRVYLVPRQEVFDFRKPMARIETITFQFRTPYAQEVFDPDFGVYTVTFGNPTLFTITSPSEHLLNTGDLIYVYNLDSASQSINSEVNREVGHYITKLNATQWTIAVDSSALVGDEAGVRVYYGSKRLFLELEFTALEQ